MNRRLPVLIIILQILFMVPVSLFAKKGDLKLKHLTTEEGLPTNSIQTVFQDSRGFVWVGTNNGLVKYDGYEMETFYHEVGNPASINGTVSYRIGEDHNGYIWVGLVSKGVSRYDPYSKTFTNYVFDPEDPNSVSENAIRCIFVDSKNRVWIGSSHNGLNLYDRENDRFIRYFEDKEINKGYNLNRPLCMYEDKEGNLWIGTNNSGLYKYNEKENTLVNYKHDKNNPHSISHNVINTIFEDSENNLWIGTNGGGLNLFDRETSVFKRYQHDPENPDSIASNAVVSILEDHKGSLWMGLYSNGGLSIFNRKENRFYSYKHNPADPNSISTNTVGKMIMGHSGTIWIATNSGVNIYDPQNQKFISYWPNPAVPDSLSWKVVRTIIEDDDGTIYISTRGGGLNKFDPETETFEHFKHDRKDPNSISYNILSTIIKGKSPNTLWVGSMKGLNKFDTRTGTFKRYMHDSSKPGSLNSQWINSLCLDNNDVLWVGTPSGLNRYDEKNDSFTYYTHDPEDDTSISFGTVGFILKDSEGILWLATENGLNAFNPDTGKAVRYNNDPANPDSISDDRINTIFEDSSQNIWVGTGGAGLNKFDRGTGKFTCFTKKNGLLSDSITGISEDSDGIFWISTQGGGLSRFDRKDSSFRNYTTDDGLLDNTLWTAVFQSKDGTIYVPTSEGLNTFHPKNLLFNTYIPPVVITEFRLFNKPVFPGDSGPEGVYLEKSITYTKNISLFYKENFFSFKFSALNFTAPEKNSFAYIMEGLDKQWNYVGADQRFASYTNVPAGKYVFKVKASNNDGLWNEEGAAITILIPPPFWQTAWFRILIIMVVLALISALFWGRMRLLQRDKIKLEELVDTRTVELRKANEEIEEKEKQKTDFFINLAHETKTPLTLISNYLEKYIAEAGCNDDLQIIRDNLRKLSTDMINFMDVEKLTKGRMHFNHNQITDISRIIQEKSALFEELARQKQLELTFVIEKELYVKMDPHACERIINNLIHNAVKYTGPGGTISVSLKAEQKELKFRVKDSGIGISEEQKERIFQPYYQVSHKKRNIQGIGMGLFICKQIIDSVKGDLYVNSKTGKGSTFEVTLSKYPVQKEDVISEDIEYSKPVLRTEFRPDLQEKNFVPGKHTLLVVEDNPDLLLYLHSSLKETFNVFTAHNGKNALDRLETIPKPDVIISDIMMDVMDGHHFLAEATKRENLHDIPFIFLTAKTTIEDKIKGLQGGAIDYIYKPFLIEEVFSKITSIIRLQKMKQALFEKSKFSTIGMLVSGISHEILNPLNNIYGPLGNLEMRMEKLPEEQQQSLRKYVDKMYNNLHRINSLVKSLKNLYYEQGVLNEDINIKLIVQSIKEILYNKLEDRIEVIDNVDENFALSGNADVLTQILVNLVSNGIDAISDKGTITVETGQRGEKKLITVRDTGKGIKKENLETIFDAFFTTKDPGKGTGLGLYIVKDLVLRMGWNIEIHSEEGEGSEFVVII